MQRVVIAVIEVVDGQEVTLASVNMPMSPAIDVSDIPFCMSNAMDHFLEKLDQKLEKVPVEEGTRH